MTLSQLNSESDLRVSRTHAFLGVMTERTEVIAPLVNPQPRNHWNSKIITERL